MVGNPIIMLFDSKEDWPETLSFLIFLWKIVMKSIIQRLKRKQN